MKKTNFLKGMLLMFVAFQFFSCENEPLTGNFPDPQDQNPAEDGQFRATVAGQLFLAESTSAFISETNDFEITGTKTSGEKIVLSVENAAVGTFSLNWDGTGLNMGSYTDRYDLENPYVSIDGAGGSGEMTITEINTVSNTVSGTFRFFGVRIKLDSTGNPILDGNGLPVMEDIEVTNGAFNSIPYLVGEGDGDGEGEGENPPNEFFARVNGQDFIADSLSVTEPINGDVHMIVIEAMNEDHELLRLDIPKTIGVGTFDMVNLSDGTKLIGLYNDNIGGDNLTSNPGTMTITEFDLVAGILTASFQFDGNDPLGNDPNQVRVRRGTFTVYFEGVPGANNRFQANIDGELYNPFTVEVTTAPVNQYPRVVLTTTLNDRKMELSFPATITVGTYEMVPEVNLGNEVVAIYYPIDGTSIPYYSETGTLEITSYDYQTRIVEGKFKFTAADVPGQDPTIYEITDGEFLAIIP